MRYETSIKPHKSMRLTITVKLVLRCSPLVGLLAIELDGPLQDCIVWYRCGKRRLAKQWNGEINTRYECA